MDGKQILEVIGVVEVAVVVVVVVENEAEVVVAVFGFVDFAVVEGFLG